VKEGRRAGRILRRLALAIGGLFLLAILTLVIAAGVLPGWLRLD